VHVAGAGEGELARRWVKGRTGGEGRVERMWGREGVVEGRKGGSSCIILSVLKHMRSRLSNPQSRLSKQGCVALHHMCVCSGDPR
jgi:hypothetical protein